MGLARCYKTTVFTFIFTVLLLNSYRCILWHKPIYGVAVLQKRTEAILEYCLRFQFGNRCIGIHLKDYKANSYGTIYPAVFYPDTLGLGGNSQHWGEMLGVFGLCPQRGPEAEPLVRWKLEAFCCISSLFWSILEVIVEL